MNRKVMITAALSGGGRTTKKENPYLPETPAEMADAAYACCQAGAAVVHLHGRDSTGRVTADPQVYREIHGLIRDRCDIIIQDSTGLGAHVATEERVRVLEAGPEMASLNMGTMVRTGWDDSIFLNTPGLIEMYVGRMRELGIKPELEVFSQSMFRDVERLIAAGLLENPVLVNLVLGVSYQGALDATFKNLLSLLDYLPEGVLFNVSATGRHQLPLTTMGMLLGGHIRVGLEDNLYYQKGQPASNEMLVARAVRIARELQLDVATPREAREILGIPQLPDPEKTGGS
ncbi:MAG: 3-keto-5-aminohexanoate cleavage protein [Bacillota bacterium]|nr:3-keto-5-aminohexanoate cleavage protein [Bacillota bacterium]MDW7684783.1 3-keto-5-aminohexanoate cleavage protein [Bacillota bacterium]